MQPTNARYHADSVSCNGRLNISSKACSRAVDIEKHKIHIKIDNVFVVSANLLFEYCDCGESKCEPIDLVLCDIRRKRALATVQVWPGTLTELKYVGQLEACDVIGFKIITCREVECIKFCGTIDIDQFKYDQILALDEATDFDKARKIRYIIQKPAQPPPPAPILSPQYPAVPVAYPWNSIVIPWRQGQVPPVLENPPGAFPNGDWYDKYQSVQYSVFFYLGIDMATIPPNSPELTIFIKNFVDRGDKNYLKKVYMYALRCETMPKYAEKIDTMLNEAFTAFTVSRKPVLSSFKEILIRFFLAMHVGYDNYPAFVIEYFTGFIDIVGFGDPDRPGRDAIMIRGNTLVPQVKAYFTERNAIIIQPPVDDTTLMYYWNLAGLPIESLLIESVHNIVAFAQYINTLYRLIADKLWANPAPGGPLDLYGLPPFNVGKPAAPFYYPRSPVALAYPAPVPPGPLGPVDFFAKMAAAATEKDQMNVCREAYRILAPNTNAFSKLMTGDPNYPPTQARHIWQQIMIAAQPQAPPGYPFPPLVPLYQTASYFKYDTSIYAGFDANFTCPVAPPQPPLVNFDPSLYFEISPTDNDPTYDDGTVLDKANPNLIPVLPAPLYQPFGRAYRGCAGEILNYFFTIKMIQRFKDLTFEVQPVLFPPDYTKYVTLAPFAAVPDNIFVVPNI